MTEEKIVKIKGYETLYEISNLGYVKTLKTNSNLQPKVKNKREYVRLYKDKVCTERYIDELVCEHFLTRYKDQKITYKDNDFHNCHIDNLNFVGRYSKTTVPYMRNYIVYYELEDGQYRLLDAKTETFHTVPMIDYKIYPKHFHVMKGYQQKDTEGKKLPMTDDDLIRYAQDFDKYASEIKRVTADDDCHINYIYFYNHFTAVPNVLTKLVPSNLYDTMTKITLDEHNLFNKCHTGGHMY